MYQEQVYIRILPCSIRRQVTPFGHLSVFKQPDQKNKQMDNSQFDYMNFKNLWFNIGGKRYPEDPRELDFDNGRYALAYDAFLNFQRRFFKTDSPPYMATIPYVDKNNFKSMYPIYSFDLTNQTESISNAKSKITLHVGFNKQVSPPGGANEGTICYIVVVPNCVVHYEPAKNKITKID